MISLVYAIERKLPDGTLREFVSDIRIKLLRLKFDIMVAVFKLRYLGNPTMIGHDYKIPNKYSKILEFYGYESNDTGTIYSKQISGTSLISPTHGDPDYCCNIDLILYEDGWSLWVGGDDGDIETYFTFNGALRAMALAELNAVD